MGMNNCHIKVEQATINDSDEPRTMSSFLSDFNEIDTMFLKFVEDLNNPVEGSSSMDKNLGTAQPYPTSSLSRRAQSRLLELERYVHANGRIPMSIALGVENPTLIHAVCFNHAIGVWVRKTFSVCCLRWADVEREYIKVVKGDLQRFFMLDFNDQAMNRFVEHQMLSTFKEFRGDCHRHFKKYNDLEEACPNPPYILVGRMED
ncbi:CACTA en-spm transposon protein [Cucumis melo var. makuwa]|uniref:CACTA en-spm transposon protein n=1 Tax=Cucumis melo var. makuwa TaxID=1194695 RepID=A0A5D3DYW1_CUCMM|nr:CACTA en-spm transposon protein [Cucumis melo var. makuwa]